MAVRFLEISDEEMQTLAEKSNKKEYSQNYSDVDECLDVVDRKQGRQRRHY